MNNRWFKATTYQFSYWLQYHMFGVVVAPHLLPLSSNRIFLLLLTTLLLSLFISIAPNSLLFLSLMKNFLIFHSCLCRVYCSLYLLMLHWFHPHYHFHRFLYLVVWSREQKRGGKPLTVTVPTTRECNNNVRPKAIEGIQRLSCGRRLIEDE